MIAYLRGTLLEKAAGTVIVLAGGVGYEVDVPISTYTALPDPGLEVNLRIYTKVSEDAISLYGFLTATEKRAFERLISVSGIGPSLAVKVLSGIAVESLVACLRSGDVASLTRIPGIGKKTAERMIVELKDKMDDLPSGPGAVIRKTSNFSPLEQDVLSALINLGSNAAAAEQAVTKAKATVTSANFEELFRKCLELVR
ncbi:MAG: Holliday junction branch migration protein RuvA [Acidobacteria bacterium]|nr:Holliday junction branch migration protein RuvA [Acidobacteriota bacterium]